MKTKGGKKSGQRPSRAPAPRRTRGGAGATAAPVSRVPSPPIDPRWSWHYRTLVALRDRLVADSKVKRNEATDAIEPHSMHLADSATDEFDHDLALTLLGREENAITDVTDAIARIEKGTYGICEATRVRIPAARLRALPWCRYAREVEEQLERSGVVTKPRIPGAVSLQGVEEIPAAGEPERESEEEVEPPEGPEAAKVIAETASATTEEIEPTASVESPSPSVARPRARRSPGRPRRL